MNTTYTAEYGTVPESDMSQRTVLAFGQGAFKRHHELVYKTAGYEMAGSCLRITGEAWGSLNYDRKGTSHGQWYKSLAEAQENFLRLTTAIIEIKA